MVRGICYQVAKFFFFLYSPRQNPCVFHCPSRSIGVVIGRYRENVIFCLENIAYTISFYNEHVSSLCMLRVRSLPVLASQIHSWMRKVNGDEYRYLKDRRRNDRTRQWFMRCWQKRVSDDQKTKEPITRFEKQSVVCKNYMSTRVENNKLDFDRARLMTICAHIRWNKEERKKIKINLHMYAVGQWHARNNSRKLNFIRPFPLFFYGLRPYLLFIHIRMLNATTTIA